MDYELKMILAMIALLLKFSDSVYTYCDSFGPAIHPYDILQVRCVFLRKEVAATKEVPLWYTVSQGCKRYFSVRDRDETETFGFQFKTRPTPIPFGLYYYG